MRRALLIAVDRFDKTSEFASLGSPATDAANLADVLEDPEFGAFDSVELITNSNSSETAEGIERFLSRDCSRSDSALLYFSGHGRLDPENGLCFVTTNTTSDRLLSTSVPASLIHQMLDRGPARQLIVLDCCFSGAFPTGMAIKSTQVHAPAHLGDAVESGRGRVILSATERFEYAFEDRNVSAPGSVYTRAMIGGIRTGAADLDHDGLINTHELHDYIIDKLRNEGHPQQPHRWAIGTQGDFVVARAGAEISAGPERPVRIKQRRLVTPIDRTRRATRRRLLTAGLLVSAMLAFVTAIWALPNGDDFVMSPRQGAYAVTLSGSAEGGEAFERQGTLRVYPLVDSDFKLCLQVGNPYAAQDLGAIAFGTHGDCFGSELDAAVTAVATDNDTFIVSPDPKFAAQPGLLNSFSVSVSNLILDFIPDGGSMSIEPDGRRITGGINLRGLVRGGGATSATYTATYSATLVSDDPDEIISTPKPGASDLPVALGPSAVRYRVGRIISFEQVEGQASWLASAQTRFSSAAFEISDSEFVYAPEDASTELFPLVGRVSKVDEIFVLSGSAEGTGTTVQIGGTLDFSSDEPTLAARLTSTSENPNGDVVSEYEIRATLVIR